MKADVREYLREQVSIVKKHRFHTDERIMRGYQSKGCAYCGDDFSGNPNQIYCTVKCREKARYRRRHGIEAQKIRDDQLQRLEGY